MPIHNIREGVSDDRGHAEASQLLRPPCVHGESFFFARIHILSRLVDLVAVSAPSAPRSVVVISEQLFAPALVIAVSLVLLCVQQRRFVLVPFIAWAVFAHAGPLIVAWPLLRHG